MRVAKIKERLLPFFSTGTSFLFKGLSDVLFAVPDTLWRRRVRRCLNVLLYVLGIVFIVRFFESDTSILANDWIKEYMYLNALRDAKIMGIIPWHWSAPFYHETTKLMANPEIIFTPDILLLRWLSNRQFVVLHVALFYSAGFLASLKLAAGRCWGFVPFVLFWLVFNMNGFITAHLGIGHLQWAAYYLLPAFLLLFAPLCQKERPSAQVLHKHVEGLSVLLFVMLLNGSFHVATWCLLFMTAAVMWDRRLWLPIGASVMTSGLLGVFRLLPAAVYFPKSPEFVSGFPSLTTVVDGLTVIRGRHYETLGGTFGRLRWWEYDIYIGVVALVLLLIGLTVVIRRKSIWLPVPLLAASVVLFVLSLGDVYACLPESGIPFSTVIRVSSRLISIPLVVFFAVGVQGLDVLLKAKRSLWKRAVTLGLVFVVFELLTHASYWNIAHLDALHAPVTKPDLSILSTPSSAYRAVVSASWAVSMTTLMLVLSSLGFSSVFRKKQVAADL